MLITYLPSLLLSNFVFPVENMPGILQLVTRIVPATYFIDILNGLYLRNLGISTLWPSCLDTDYHVWRASGFKPNTRE